MGATSPPRPEVGDILVAIHDFQARSSDELTLNKGDQVELQERDDEYGDGWFLGKHLASGNSGLFPEVYTRPLPQKHIPNSSVASSTRQSVRNTDISTANEEKHKHIPSSDNRPPLSTNVLPIIPNSDHLSHQLGQRVLHETLNVINEHITDMSANHANRGLRVANDSESEYSSHRDHRISYIHGEETDEEEEAIHSRAQVETWTSDQVAEYLFTVGVEKQHCEVFRDQEITGEVLLAMDQSSIFIKALDLGSVGRRLKTWHKIKKLQEEVKGGETASVDGIKSIRSASNPPTVSGSVTKWSAVGDDGPVSSAHSQRPSMTRSTTRETTQSPITPVSPSIAPTDIDNNNTSDHLFHSKRPSASSTHSNNSNTRHVRRHSSSADFRPPSTLIQYASSGLEKLGHSSVASGPSAAASKKRHSARFSHKKLPSFDRNWTMGNALMTSPFHNSNSSRPLSSDGFHDDESSPDGQHTHAPQHHSDLDRGYFSGTEADGRRRSLFRKRDSMMDSTQSHSRKASFASGHRAQNSIAAARSRHSRNGSVGSTQMSIGSAPPQAAQKYYGLPASITTSTRRRRSSAATYESTVLHHMPAEDTLLPPIVTKLDMTASVDDLRSPSSPLPSARPSHHHSHKNSNQQQQQQHLSLSDMARMPALKASTHFGLRAISDAITSHEKLKILAAPSESISKNSPLHSPSRTGSSTASVGPSFELYSPDAATAKSPSTATTVASSSKTSGRRSKSKKETSAYLRGLQMIGPRKAIRDADYSGWMKKKSSNLMTTWKPRLFVLKGRRLAYYYSEDDDQEKGLIDISFHRVLPAGNERLTGLHAALTRATSSPTMPANSSVPTLAATEAEADDTEHGPDAIFIFKLVPPRAGLSRAVNFTKPTVHYFAVPNIKQGRLWMAALMRATIDRDDSVAVTTTYQQKTISLTKAQQQRHRPPALMNLDPDPDEKSPSSSGPRRHQNGREEEGEDKKEVVNNYLAIVFNGHDNRDLSTTDSASKDKHSKLMAASAGPTASTFNLGPNLDTSATSATVPQSA